MKSKASLVFVILSFFLLSGNISAQQSDTPQVTDNPKLSEDHGGDPVDSTGRTHYQQGSLGYMAGKEHYMQGKPGYMAGKEHYQSRISTSASLDSQVSKSKPTSASVGEGAVLPGGLQISVDVSEQEPSESSEGQWQIPVFRGEKPAKPPHGEWQLPVFKEERSRGKGSRKDRDSSQPMMAIDPHTGQVVPGIPIGSRKDRDSSQPIMMINPHTGQVVPGIPIN